MIYGMRNPPEDPPCGTCRVDPFPENEDALNIFFTVQTQLIMGMGGPVDINHMAVHAAMELYGIRRRRECFEKVRKLGRWWIEKQMEGG